MSRGAIPTWFFVLVVVRSGERFLLVQERRHGRLWYLPAGRVEVGERLVGAARRETLEEAGIPIELEGVLEVQHTPSARGYARVRVIFVARPADDTPPKSTPDDDTLQAAWVTVDEAERLPLRGDDVLRLLHMVAVGAPVYPLTLIGREE